MNRLRTLARPALTLAATASALTLLVAPAIAQVKPIKDVYYGDATEIVIVAPPPVYREEGSTIENGRRVEEISLTTSVTTAGLDLRSDAGVDALHARIRATAQELCDRIDAEMHGQSATSDRECVRDATRGAMAQADNIVAYYRG